MPAVDKLLLEEALQDSPQVAGAEPGRGARLKLCGDGGRASGRGERCPRAEQDGWGRGAAPDRWKEKWVGGVSPWVRGEQGCSAAGGSPVASGEGFDFLTVICQGKTGDVCVWQALGMRLAVGRSGCNACSRFLGFSLTLSYPGGVFGHGVLPWLPPGTWGNRSRLVDVAASGHAPLLLVKGPKGRASDTGASLGDKWAESCWRWPHSKWGQERRAGSCHFFLLSLCKLCAPMPASALHRKSVPWAVWKTHSRERDMSRWMWAFQGGVRPWELTREGGRRGGRKK